MFQPHPGLYQIIASNVLEHYARYKENKVDKIYASMYFYLGGARTGKSRHGLEFASSIQEAIKSCPESTRYSDELMQRLKKAFVFYISFEYGTTLSSEEPWNAIARVGDSSISLTLTNVKLMRKVYANSNSYD